MKSDIGHFSFQWLLAAEPRGAGPIDDERSVQRLDYNVAPELGEAWLERLELNGSFSLYHAVHHFEKAPLGRLLPMAEIKFSEPEDIFCAQTWLAGNACHEEYWHGRNAPLVEIRGGADRDTFRYTKNWDARLLVAGGESSEMHSITIPASVLRTFLGESNASELLDKLGLCEQLKAVNHPMPSHVTSPLRDAMSERYSGPVRRLYAQARVLDYLGELINFLCTEDRKPIERRHGGKLRELKEYLLSLEGRLPTLNQLADEFGLSAKQLNAEFKAEFGQSIFAFVTTSRLEQAREMLLESSLPMKVIAARLGYSHVNHFITAFGRRYGYPPGGLRKHIKAEY